MLAVLDPVDGSTNASRRIPWFATSICVLDEEGPLAALVVNQATGTRYEAMRGGGARRDGEHDRALDQRVAGPLADRTVRVPAPYLGWRRYRALGAAALDLCAVADGTLDGYIDCMHGRARKLGLPGRPARLCRGRRLRRRCRGTRARREGPFRPPHARGCEQLGAALRSS